MGIKYIAKVGITYTVKDGKKRVEEGEIVPAFVIKRSPWLLEQDLVEEAEEVIDDGARER